MANSVEKTYTAVTSLATISTANSARNGTGSITDLVTGSTNGTLVKSVIIKSQTNTSEGMVRLFVYNSTTYRLLAEKYVSPVTISGTDPSFQLIIPLGYTLKSSEKLSFSTENADTFNIIVESMSIGYSVTTSYLSNTLEYIANGGDATVNTANPNLDGTGSLQQVFTAGLAAAQYKGCMITSLVIKSQVSTTPGMIRLYIQDDAGGSKYLFTEIPVPNCDLNGHIPSFTAEAILHGTLCLAPGYSIWASTEVGQAINVIAEAKDWKYV